MKLLFPILAALLLGACAAYGGRGLAPGTAWLAEVIGVMGKPAMRWQNPDGSVQLAYPRGPAGYHTFMVRIGPDGKLKSVDNVLEYKGFAQIRPGMSEAQVLQVLGPPYPAWTSHFQARDERVWQWHYCDDWYNAAHFSVLFDATSRTVRTAMSVSEQCGQANCVCTK